MDVFSLIKFWRNAGVGDPINPADFDISDDETSFFDLVFTNPNNDQCYESSKMDNCNLKSKSNPNHTYSSPSPHTVFFNNKRKISPIDASNAKTPKSPFRVFMLGFQNIQQTKTKSAKKEMKCEIEEVTISSLLKRDQDQQMPSKRFSKDAVNKYFNLIKFPLYIKVSRRSSSNTVRLSEHSSFSSSKYLEDLGKASGRTVFKEVCKHLGKSRSSSASSAVKPVPSTAVRRDDLALQQHDGIQSAILHCKKSYNSPSQGCNVLSRSGSAPSQGSRMSVGEEKRSSI